jgi:hypothetical protein
MATRLLTVPLGCARHHGGRLQYRSLRVLLVGREGRELIGVDGGAWHAP